MEDYGFSSNLSSAYSRKLVICCGTDGLERTGPRAAVMEIPQGGSREQVSHKLFPQAPQGVAGCQHFHTSPAFSCMLAKALIFSGVKLSPEALRMVKD